MLWRSFFLLSLFAFLPINCNAEKSLFDKGWEAEKEGRLSEAIYYYELSLNENSEYLDSHRRIGSLLSKNPESWGVAIWHLEKALSKNPKDNEVRLELSFLYLANEKWTDFEKQLSFWNTHGEREFFTGLTALYNCNTKSGKLQSFAEVVTASDFIPEFWKARCQEEASNR
jgi:tetratricopeptide (TPR) repeat protein